MKSNMIRSLLVACCVLASTALLAAPTAQQAANSVTVGDFVVRLADTLNPAGGEIKGLDQAKAYFSGQGVVLPANLDLNAPLTQMDVAVVMSLLGVDVNAQEPDSAFDRDAVNGFIGFIRGEVENGRISRTGATAAGSDGRPPLELSGLGACCCPSQPCFQSDPTPCHDTAPGCIYKGKGVPCSSPNPCAPGTGACCTGRGLKGCTITGPFDCDGIFTGRDSCFPPGQACKNPEPVTPSEP